MKVIAKNEETRVELDKAMGALFSIFMTNPSRLNQIAQLAQSDPKLFIEEMEKRLYTREQIQRNQAIGSLVEKLLKDILEKEGFKVKVTGVGSDFVIENDFVKDNMETIFEVKKEDRICLYIEVKTTSQDFVKMTLNQAHEAKDKMDRYALCVIQLNSLKISEEIDEEYIRKQAKFVMNIGEKIRDKVEKVENLKAQQEAISEAGDIEVEISEGPIRFKINKTVWEEGKTFEQFLEFTRGFKYE
ncbi:DUF3883 domain-containing protein [Candidatus Kryptobacter tengchongensis]|uniref:Uncharacterized protein n=1 Tax=Kryptobacter tengchongensis TaxID=1643429 RepID=A0A656D2T0_KRYT1|nr:DUF3883 domain-containing protein [Candidatus Kryptobacter tengchongensis]CUS96540.1 protein of unknown function (DUF3883) [Candidatus Kryptobacter tengchongensis]